VSYLSASEVMIHYEEALYQVSAPLPFLVFLRVVSSIDVKHVFYSGHVF